MVTLGVIEFNAEAYDSESKSQLGALARRRLGNASVLEWVARRVSESLQIDKVVVVAGDGPLSELARQCTPSNITLFVSPESNSLGRLLSAAQKYGAESVVRVCVNNPFIDPVLIDRLVAAAKQDGGCEYVGFADPNGERLDGARGMLAEWFSVGAIERACKLGGGDGTAAISEQPSLFQSLSIPAPSPLAQQDVRLIIDVEEDWEHAQVIYDALGPESLDWQGITELLYRQPAIRERMAVLNRSA